MPQFLLNKRLILSLVSIIVLVALIGFSMRERSKLSWPEQLIKDTTGFVQSIVSMPAHVVAGFFEDIQSIQKTYEENQILKQRLDEYVQLKVKVNDLERKNEELQRILNKDTDLSDYNPIEASVLARNPDRWNEIIVIDKGEVNGVEKGMAVITVDGMIGKVKSTSKFTSNVQLLSTMDPLNRISAIVQGEEDVFGVIHGYDSEKERLLLKEIPVDKKIKKGQDVITSGLGCQFPRGIYIGKIKEVVPDKNGLTQTAYIETSADLYDLDYVMVAKRVMECENVNLAVEGASS